jgi:hypothetical protein
VRKKLDDVFKISFDFEDTEALPYRKAQLLLSLLSLIIQEFQLEGFSSIIGLPKPTLDTGNVSSAAEPKPDLKKASAKLRRFNLVCLTDSTRSIKYIFLTKAMLIKLKFLPESLKFTE